MLILVGVSAVTTGKLRKGDHLLMAAGLAERCVWCFLLYFEVIAPDFANAEMFIRKAAELRSEPLYGLIDFRSAEFFGYREYGIGTQFLYCSFYALLFDLVGEEKVEAIYIAHVGMAFLWMRLAFWCVNIIPAKKRSAQAFFAKGTKVYLALAPSLSVYSVIPLRESVIYLAIVFVVVTYIKYLRSRKSIHVVITTCWVLIAAAFHPGLIILIVLPLAILMRTARAGTVRGIMALLLTGALLYVFFGQGVGAYKYKQIEKRGVIVGKEHMTSDRIARDDIYLSVELANGPLEVLLFFPLKLLEFSARPAPFEIRSVYDFVRCLDSLVCVCLLGIVLYLFLRKKLSAIGYAGCGAFFLLLIVFCWGSDEFSQGHRHRAKILTLMPLVGLAMVGRQELQRRNSMYHQAFARRIRNN